MALDLTPGQRALMNSDNIKARVLTTWYMDHGTYRYCDDHSDITLGANTWIGASALAACSEIKSGQNMSAEPVTITIDGTRMYQAGFGDPAAFFRLILELPLPNRRVKVELALGYADQEGWVFALPMFSGKINNVKLEDPQAKPEETAPQQSKLIITLDALSIRYGWATYRVRTHQDQLDIDPTDMFFSFVHENQRNESTLYWGKKAPTGSVQRVVTGNLISDAIQNARNGFYSR